MQTVQTLQERINENAENRLRKHLVEVSQKENEIKSMLGYDFYTPKISAFAHYTGENRVDLKDEFTKKVWDALLPNFIKTETDSILNKLSEIEYFLAHPQERDL